MKTTGMSLEQIVASYDETAPLAEASTIPASWYVDERIAELERQTVFSRTWQVMGRVDQVEKPGQFVTATVAGEPLVAVRGSDGVLRAFYNVCRHHAAAVVTEPCGQASILHCPYHGWNYGLDGTLKGMPEFEGVRNFERKDNGLVPVKVETWEKFVFVNLDPEANPLSEFLGGLVKRVAPLGLTSLQYFKTSSYDIHCNWKVFVDNYLDGGYHVNTVHPGLAGALDYAHYRTELHGNNSVQVSPLKPSDDPMVSKVRTGTHAYYWWIFPNLMVNLYQGVMDTNLVVPLGPDRCRVLFDFYFADVASEQAKRFNADSIAVAHQVQLEDWGVCEEVQRGLKSRSYNQGRFSVRRESGGYHFHQMLARTLRAE